MKNLKDSFFYWLVSVRKIKLMIKLLLFHLRWIKTRLKMEVDKNSSEYFLNPFFRNSICGFDYKIACIIHIRFFHYNWASIVKTHHLFLLSLNLFFSGWDTDWWYDRLAPRHIFCGGWKFQYPKHLRFLSETLRWVSRERQMAVISFSNGKKDLKSSDQLFRGNNIFFGHGA